MKNPTYETAFLPESYVNVVYSTEESDYGVDGSPIFDEIVEMDIYEVYIFGHAWTPKTLADEFGEFGSARLMSWLEWCAVEDLAGD